MYKFLSALCGGCAILLAGCAQIPEQGVVRTGLPELKMSDTEVAQAPPVYLISPNDEFEVQLGDRADLVQTTRVQADGTLQLRDFPPLLVGGLSLGQAQTHLRALVADTLQKSAATGGLKYLLAVGDELEVRFTYYPTLNQVVKVRPDGHITLPFVKAVQVEGMVPEVLAEQLTKQYLQYLKKPDLSVVVRSFGSYRVTSGTASFPSGIRPQSASLVLKSFSAPQIFVAGEVARPGVLGYRPGLSLLQAIIEAGGHKPTAEMRSVLVLRRASNGEGLLIRRDIAADLKAGLRNDVALLPSDIVVLPKTQIATVAEAVDQYLYQVIAPLRNSSLGFVYNLTPETSVQVK